MVLIFQSDFAQPQLLDAVQLLDALSRMRSLRTMALAGPKRTRIQVPSSHQLLKVLSFQAAISGSGRDISVVPGQSFYQVSASEVPQQFVPRHAKRQMGTSGVLWCGAGPPVIVSEVTTFECVPFAEYHRLLDGISELPDVAGPRTTHEKLHGICRYDFGGNGVV